jgi:FSR family fosmidomycin resistance protein-like MFS transporter
MLALCVVVTSLGSSLFHPVAAAAVGGLAPQVRRGRWMGLFETAGWAGTVVGPLVVGFTVERLGPGGIWPAAVPAVLLALLLVRLTPQRPAAPPALAAARPTDPTTATDRPAGTTPPSKSATHSQRQFLALFTTVGSLRAWVYYATALMLPLLGSEVGLGPGGAAQLVTVFLAAGVLGSLVGGAASDRVGARWIIAGTLVLTVPVGLTVALVEPAGPSLFALAAASGFLLTGANTGLTLAGQQQLPDDAGMVTGLNVGLTSGIGGLAVVPLASLADDVGLRIALASALTAGPLLALAVWLLAGRRPHPSVGTPSPA